MLTKVEADRIVEEPKEIWRSVRWDNVPSRGIPRYRLETEVRVPGMADIRLRLRGFIRGDKYNFALLYENYCLRRYDTRPPHHNPGCENMVQPHKHCWDETYGDKRAYAAIDISTGDPDGTFMNFLRECNIKLLGEYGRPARLF